MCLTVEALALFLNMIAAPVSAEPGRIIVHAEVHDAHWVRVDGDEVKWCTDAPKAG
ncbi:hypothetical protein [Celeribacter arenosi]|uniref:Uncharacterized protein n=1 Tax=Celeribacter arenosi TaxID=792649 RepID=A0ABP7K3S4_9RHOB